ncbi:hypothetical protein K450DRAFT_248175 [Umbelopsis ramanniana AG]|uniref:Mitochondrial inner membrane protease ATP23 n=1 Tax=Umbelopsis ramanniana AG TaxID=1314678 RepID=A0AAD5E7U5_UMBRA|nr:uncharacterized protein K450DRAFT_248175 [Umbelopsis ramanniana AG]KAI8578299.1 hypothetical protein K450DRAFT_248175 [Umbelopsis ramanniana AG]
MPILTTNHASSFSEQRCTEELQHVLNNSSKAQTLLQSIFKLNKRTLVKGITCRSCAGTEQQEKCGYYDIQYKRIVLCCENIRSREDVEKTVVHELVHAFDASRKGTFDSLCHLVACGEVRASAIGQCNDIKHEGKKKDCILRDAINSTREHCGANAEKVVQQVYEKCVRDEAPFT